MEQWAWFELEAQVEGHGPGAVEFYLDQEDPETGENMVLTVLDVSLVDDEVRVTLG